MIVYADGPASAGSPVSMFFPLILMGAFFYFFMIKPQKKRQQQLQDMKNSIKVGDKVVLYSGLIATVIEVIDDTLILQSEVDETRNKFKNWSVREVLKEDEDEYEEDEDITEQLDDEMTDTEESED